MKNFYVIFSRKETLDELNFYSEPLFWSNDWGWVSLETATVFTADEALSMDLNLPDDGVWLKLPRTDDVGVPNETI